MFEQDEAAVARASERARQDALLRSCLAAGVVGPAITGGTTSLSTAPAEEQPRTFRPGTKVKLITDGEVPAGSIRFADANTATVEWPNGSSTAHNLSELRECKT